MIDNTTENNFISQIVLPPTEQDGNERLYLIKDKKAHDDISILQSDLNSLDASVNTLDTKVNNIRIPNTSNLASKSDLNNALSNFITRAEVNNSYVKWSTLLSNYSNNTVLNNNYAHMTNGVIDNASINYEDVEGLNNNYAHITANGIIDNAIVNYTSIKGLNDNYAHLDSNGNIDNAYINYVYINGLNDNYAHLDSSGSIDNASINYVYINGLNDNYAHLDENNVIDNANIDYSSVNGLYNNFAHISGQTIDNAYIDYSYINGLTENFVHMDENGIIDNAQINYADIQDLNAHYAEIENGKIKNATINYAQVDDLYANYAKIERGTIVNATIDQADVNNLDANYAHITQGVIDNAYIDYGRVNYLSSHYAHISEGVIDNALIDQANVNDLDAHYAHIEDGVIDNATISYANIDDLEANYAHITNGVIDNATIGHAQVNDLYANYAHIEDGVIDNATIDQADVNNLEANYAHITDGVIDNATISYANINDLDAHYAHIEDGIIDNATIDQANVNNLDANYAHITNGVIDNATISYADVDNLEANYAHITDGVIDNATIDYADINDLEANYAHITNGIIDTATINYADVNDLDAHYAHITDGVIDRATISYANVDDLNAHYAEIDIANVNNAWIENGVIKDAAISDAKIIGVSANKLTAGTIDASNINVTNLRADNLIATRINGQPVIGGYTLVNSSSVGYANKNPSEEGWYELSNNGYILSTDTTINNNKKYYRSSDSIELYDQTTINGMVDDLNARIDSQIETWTTDAVPTLNNYPAEDWLTNDERAEHIGDICYVLNAGNNYDGFTYRFAYDNTSNQYMWVLIKDNQVTAALGRLTNAENKITGLETFETNTSTWITQTDQGLETIRSNYTTLSGRVDKTVKSTVQLWFTKANTTAPSAPTSVITNNSPTGANSYNKWNLAVPEYNANYPYYYYCWQYTFEDDTTGWSAVIYDRATTEAEERARTGIANAAAAQTTADNAIKSSIQLWFAKANDTPPSKPESEVTSSETTGNAWRKVCPAYNSSYPYYFYCYQQQKGDGTFQWTDVIYDRAITETQSTSRTTASNLSNYITSNDQALESLQNQLDGQLEIWYGSVNPTNTTSPASTWDATDKDNHIGDLYYNTTDGTAWQWIKNGSTYSWTQIPDNAAAAALSAAQDAKDTADGKRRVFTTTPTVPYDKGDLWVNGDEIKYATTAKTSSQSYSVSDWAQTATDDTAANAAQTTANQNIKSTVQLWFSKANNTAPNPPTSHVTSTATTGNGWTIAVPAYNSAYPYYYYCYEYQKGDGTYFWSSVIYDRATTETQSTARATSSSLSNYITNNDAALAALQSQVDNQLEIWYGDSDPTTLTQPASSWDNDEKANHVGDLYYNTTDGSTWQWTVDNSVYSWTQIPDSAASVALAAAQDAQATADGKRRIFTSTPTVPYDIGDLWVTGNQVKYATVKKTSSQSYAAADWSQTATDDTMASANIKSSVQLWYTSNSTTPPNKPYTDSSSSYVSSTSTNGNTWTTVVPLYNSSTPKYHYCYQQQRGDGKYQWTTPVYDDATTTAMAKAQSALPSQTFIDFQSSTFKDVVDTVEEQSTSITNLTTITENNGLTSSTNITNSVSTLSQTVNGITADIESLQNTVDEKADGSTVESLQSNYNTLSETVDGHTQSIGSINNTLTTKADGSTVTSLTTRVNNISDTVDGHTSSLSNITSTQTSMQNTLNKTVKASIQLWYSKQNTTAPNPPTSQVTNNSTNGGAWTTVVPAYNATYPNYYYCWQYQYTDNTYGWSAVIRDIAMGETQSTSRTAATNASNAVSTANTASQNATNAVNTANNAASDATNAIGIANGAADDASDALQVANTANGTANAAQATANAAETTANAAESTANTANSTANTAKSIADKNVKTAIQLWYTKSNTTLPNKPTSVVTSNSTIGNGWRTVVPTYNSTYPYYYYCYQYELADGTYDWSAVVYDQATTETQSTARTATSNLANYITTNNAALQTLQNQVDGQIEAWYYSVDPTTSNAPAEDWTTDTLKSRHEGDLYYNVSNGHSWRWLNTNGTYGWQQIPDSDAAAALAAAQNAQTTANNKRRIFTTTPTVPYDVGDLWVNGSEVKYATVSKASTGTYSASDWTQTATDDTAANAAQDTANANIKSSVMLWYSKENNTAPNKPSSHVTSTSTNGGAWRTVVPTYNSSYPYYFYCYEYQKGNGTYTWSDVVYDRATTETQSTARATASSLSSYITSNNSALAALQSQVDGQLEIWYGTSNPTTSNAPASGWDATAKANHVGDIYYNTTSGAAFQWTVSSNTYSWTAIPDSAASAALQAANDAQATADGKRRVFTSTPTVPYDIGDLWVNGDEVKYATTARSSGSYTATDWTQTATDDTAANAAQNTANTNIKSSTQLWFTKADATTAPNKPTTQVTTSNANTTNAWNLVVPIWNSSYPHYYYCYQQQKGDGTWQWTDVVYDRATSEAQQLANTVNTNVNSLQLDYANFKQTTQNFESTIGTTYATKTEVSAVNNKIDNLEIGGRNLLLGTGVERSQLYSNTTVTRWAFAFSGNLPVGIYTISFYAKSSNGTDKFYASIANDATTVVRVVDENQGTPSTYKLYSSTFNYTSTATSNGFFITSCSDHGSPHNNGNNGTVYFKDVKLERGDKATDWTPAPEDVDSAISAIPRMMKVNTPAKNFTASQWKLYGTRGRNESWSTGSSYNNSKLRVGDRAYVVGTVSDQNGGTATVIGEVTAINPVGSGTTNVYLKAEQLIFGGDIVSAIESRVSTAETSITQNNEQIALKANASDVYTKTQTDGLISTEVSNRNSAIEQSASAINLSVSQTYTTKTEFNALEIGGRNLALNTAGVIIDKTTLPNAGSEYTSFDLGRALPFGAGTPIVISFDLYMLIKSGSPQLNVYNTNNKGPHQTLRTIDILAGKNLTVGSIVDERIVIETSVYIDRSDATLPHDYLEFYSIYNSNNYYRISNLKVEKGTKATDWSPAPEDMVSQTEFESTKSEIKATTDGITSTVSKISSAKYLVSAISAGNTLDNIKHFASTQTQFSVVSTENARVGDTVYLRYKDSTRNCYVYIKGTVVSINSETSITLDTHGYEDVLPVDTIKSTINQSSDSVKIQARHVEIDGAAIFSNSAFKAAADAAYDPIGSAAAAQSAAASDATTKANNAKSAAISTAASDATTKANNAKSAAISAAATDATNKANAAQAAAISAAATDATNKADAAQNAAISAAATDATNKANAVQTNLDNLEIGGRNLLRYRVYNYADANNVIVVASSYRGMYCAIDGGETYTISRKTIEGNRFWIEWSEQEPASGVSLHALSTNNTSMKVTVNVPSEANWLFIYLSNQGDEIHDGNIKIERGTKATDWTPAPEDIDANIAAVQTIANGANAQEQIIYKSAVSGTASMTGTTTWITDPTGNQETWTTKRPIYNSSRPVLFVATQRKTVGGTITCTTPQKDDTTTIIDGGHITTGTIDASVVTVTNLNANEITSGSLTSTNYMAAATTGVPYSALGSKIELSTGNIYTPSFGVINNSTNQNYPVGLYINDGFIAKSGKIGWSSENYWDVGTLPINNSTYTTGIVATGNSLINVGELILESNNNLNNNASLHTGTISKSSTTYTRNYLRDSDNYYRDYGLQAPVLNSSTTNYTAGVDDNFIYIKKSPTNSAVPSSESDWNYLFRIDKEGNLYTTGSMYINGQLVQSGGNFVKVSGDSSITGNLGISGNLTITNGSLTGSLNKSITFAASGGAAAGSSFNNSNNLTVSYATIGAAASSHTHSYLPLAGGTLSGGLNFSNGSAAIGWTDGAVRQRIKITDDSTANTNVFEFQQSTNSGSSYTSLFTIKDNGTVVATTFSGALSGNATSATTAASATKDSEGNQISTTYLKLSGGTLIGDLTTSRDIVINGDLYTNNELYADSETVGNLIVTGNATFSNGLTGDLTGTAEKATKDSAGNQINTTYIKGLSISGKTITYTKGDNTTGTITTQDTTYTNGTGLSLNGTQFYVTSANVSTMINLLTEGTGLANRNDYAVVQYVNGGTTTTTYHRRKLSNVFAALNASDITTALGFTPYNNTNPNNFTSNTGTVTSVILKAGSGITLDTDNTAITTTGTRTISHANTSSQASITASDRTYIKSVTLDTYGHVTGLTTGTESVTDTHYTAYLYAGTSTGSANAQTTNGNTYLILKDGNSVSSRNKITGSGTVSVASDANGVITITGSAHPTALKNPNALAINVYNGSATATTTNYDGATANQSVNVASNNAITGISASTSGGSTTFTLTTAAGGTSTFDVNITGAVVTGATTLTGSDGANINVGGATTAPVYFSEGLPVAVTSIPYSLISGKPTITLNGSATNTPSWYAPTGAGTNGQILKSNGSGAPSWVNTSTITAGAATKATNDSDGNAINSTYLKKSGGTMTGALKTAGVDIILGTSNTSSEDSGDLIWHHSDGTEKGRIWMPNAPTVKQGPNYRILNLEGTTLYTGTLPLSDGTGASGTWGISITGNAATATSATSATSATKLSNYYNSRPVSANINSDNSGSLKQFFATSTMTTGKPSADGRILHFDWDNSNNWAYQLAIIDGGHLEARNQTAVDTWGDWNKVLDSSNYTTYTVTKTGSGASGTWGISISGNAATATSATSATKLGSSNVGTVDRPIYLSSGTATQTTYRMAATNAVATTSRAITENLETGIWYVNGTNSTDLYSINDGVAYVNKYSDAWIAEIYQDYRTGQIALRGKNNGTWQAWRKVLDSSNFNTWTPKLDGTGATGTWGISISGNATTATTASKITNLSNADTASSSATWRNVWISYSDNVTGRPAKTDNLVFQTSTNTLKAPHFLAEHISGGDKEFRVTYSTTVDMSFMVGTGDTNHGIYDSIANKWMIYADGNGNVTVNGNAATATKATQDGSGNVITSTYVKKAGDTMTGYLTTTNLGIANTSGTAGNGISLYGGGATITNVWNYGIAFAGTSTYGKYGTVQGDWATYFTMAGANNRGWIFKHGGGQTTSGNVASISGQGKFQGLSYNVAGHCNLEYNTTTESLDFVFS